MAESYFDLPAGNAITRRGFLAGAACLLANVAGRAEAASGSTLKELSRKKGLLYGAAVRLDDLRRDPSFKEAFLRECSSLTPEISMKWDAVEPERGRLDLTDMDDLAAFARANGLKVYGHTLLWHLGVPRWAHEALVATPDWQLVRNYLAAVIPRYGDVIDHWDVVNEPIDTGHRQDGLRESVFLDTFGPDYIERALRDARMFAPQARLMLNEFSLEYDIPLENDRRYLLLKLVERLKSRGVPLDGIGLQAHLDLRKGHVSPEKITSFLREIEGFGMEVLVTELDVKEADYAAAAEKRDAAVADEVRRYLDTVLRSPAVRAVTTWGLSDRYSWLEVTPEELAAYAGAWKNGSGPGLNRGLPLDASLSEKPMYAMMANAFSAAR